jgi:cytochrome c6
MKIKSSGIVLFFILLAAACGSESDSNTQKSNPSLSAKALYEKHCAICHGSDGRKGLSGAKMIPESKLSVKERINLITNGKGNMMPYEKVLSEEEIKAVAEFTLSLK